MHFSLIKIPNISPAAVMHNSAFDIDENALAISTGSSLLSPFRGPFKKNKIFAFIFTLFYIALSIIDKIYVFIFDQTKGKISFFYKLYFIR